MAAGTLIVNNQESESTRRNLNLIKGLLPAIDEWDVKPLYSTYQGKRTTSNTGWERNIAIINVQRVLFMGDLEIYIQTPTDPSTILAFQIEFYLHPELAYAGLYDPNPNRKYFQQETHWHSLTTQSGLLTTYKIEDKIFNQMKITMVKSPAQSLLEVRASFKGSIVEPSDPNILPFQDISPVGESIDYTMQHGTSIDNFS